MVLCEGRAKDEPGVTNFMSHKKSEFLGMNHSTASHRLRKQLLFKYVQKCDDDVCFKCKEKIKDIESLSIEHKERWLDVSADLFWDLDNIAFSHLKCNRPTINGQKKKTHCPKGHEYTKENTRIDYKGYRVCRNCGRIKWHKSSPEYRDKHRKYMREYMRSYRTNSGLA